MLREIQHTKYAISNIVNNFQLTSSTADINEGCLNVCIEDVNNLVDGINA